jgi:hypothetical protein
VCGSSSDSECASELSNVVAANLRERFHEQTAVLARLNEIITPISQARPCGLTLADLAALNTQLSIVSRSKWALKQIQAFAD